MNKKLLSEIKRMKKLAGIVNEEHFTQAELMQQDSSDDFNQLINSDLDLGDSEENSTYDSTINTNSEDVNINRTDNNQESVFNDVPSSSSGEYETTPFDSEIPADETTPADLASKDETEYQDNPEVAVDDITQPSLADETTPAEISAHAEETLYPGKYKGMYAGEHMMENDNPISKMDENSEIILDI